MKFTILPLYQLYLVQSLAHILSEGGKFMPKHVAVSLYIYNIVHVIVKMNMYIQYARKKTTLRSMIA
jgi:hypothetical protein